MRKFLLSFIIVVVIGLTGLFVARFFFGGDEDTWICANGQWVKHGNPSASMPQTGCGDIKDGWIQQTFDEAGLSLSLKIPPGMIFRKEIADDAGRIRVASFYVEKGDKNNPSYMLHAVYQPLKEASQQDVELSKTEMDSNSIKEATISGYSGIEGFIMGPKTRYITIILKNNRLFTVSTIPPTQENKMLTEQILTTFKFK